MKYSWDKAKAKTNLRKHGVSFEEAQTVFEDVFAGGFFDDEHSTYQEERSCLIGLSSKGNVLMVVYFEILNNENVRIISARRADMADQQQYWERRS